MESPTGALSPVVELSGEISEFEDFPVAGAIMQSVGSTTSINDEDEYTEGRLEVMKQMEDPSVDSTGVRKKRVYAIGIVLVMLVAGFGFLVGSRKLSAKGSEGQEEQGGLSAFSLPSGSNSLNVSRNTSGSAAPTPSRSPEHALWVSETEGESLLLSGREFRIELQRANSTSSRTVSLCLDLLSSTTPSSDRTLIFRACSDSPDTSQAFVYDPLNDFIMSKNDKGACVDSGLFNDAKSLSEAAALRLHPCGSKPWNQWFQFTPERGEFKSTHLGGCIADGAPSDSNGPAQQALATLQPCSGPPKTQLRSVMTRIWEVTHLLLLRGEQFLLRSVGKLDLCLSTAKANGTNTTGLLVVHCNSSQEDQRLTYNARVHWIQSARDPALCLDDSGVWPPGANATDGNVTTALARMAQCDEHSSSQKFVYDAFARTFRNPAKPRMCLDDGGGFFPRASAFRMAQCAIVRGNQQFALEPAAASRAFELLPETQAFAIEAVYSALCVTTDFRLRECARDAPTQRFTYDSKRQALRSAADPSHCWSRSAMSVGSALLALERCDAASARQRFVVDAASRTLRSRTESERAEQLCLDGGDGWFPDETPLLLRACAEHSQRQQFRVRAAS